jgi:hypothetical protein
MWVVEFALPVLAWMGRVGGHVGDTPEALNMERRVNMRQIPEVRTKKSFNNFDFMQFLFVVHKHCFKRYSR